MKVDIEKAMEALKAAIPRAQKDPYRPVYHFTSPAQSMNDAHGPIFFKDRYHLLYQLNPFSDEDHSAYWGQSRSRDLIHWEHLPIALAPSLEKDEARCFSGCPLIAENDRPQIIYTSIGPSYRAHWHTAEQWLVEGEPDMVRWKKYAQNPIMPESLHGSSKIWDWRDPFEVIHDGNRYIICGGNIDQRAGGGAVVTLYRSLHPQNTQWEYCGVLFTHPDKEVVNIECPNLIKLDDKWLLLVTPHRCPEYFIGQFDPARPEFTAQGGGLTDYGSNAYAHYSFTDPAGRCLMWNWVKDFPPGRGWAGCLSLLRQLSVDDQGRLMQQPLPELQTLRTDLLEIPELKLDGETYSLNNTSLNFELNLSIELDSAAEAGIRLLCGQTITGEDLTLQFHSSKLTLDQTDVPLEGDGLSPVTLQLFFDRSVVEVFINGGSKCLTKIVQPNLDNQELTFYAHKGRATFKTIKQWHLAADNLFTFAPEF